MKIAVSACLMGCRCRYDGTCSYHRKAAEILRKRRNYIAVCPETEAGLQTPRQPVEIVSGRIKAADGEDCDAAYRAGVLSVLEKLEGESVTLAVLKEKSPTCGVHQIYDGTFSGTLTEGCGIFAQELKKRGICVIDADEFCRRTERK